MTQPLDSGALFSYSTQVTNGTPPMTTALPAQLLYVAAQFASKDSCKGSIVAINVKKEGENIKITSTDGFRAFRVSFGANETFFMEEDELNLDASDFKKRVAKGKVTTLKDSMATVTDDKGVIIAGIPYKTVAGEFPNMNSAIWPDTYQNEPGAPIAFNSAYLAPFLVEVTRFTDIHNVRMNMNGPITPMQFEATLEMFGAEYEVQYLLMPVQIRNKK
jgi:DNA polymerase III sliding clamp (beta) subunit (PCNA family)